MFNFLFQHFANTYLLNIKISNYDVTMKCKDELIRYMGY